eukprot:c28504_g1_i12 orf=796-1386(+)
MDLYRLQTATKSCHLQRANFSDLPFRCAVKSIYTDGLTSQQPMAPYRVGLTSRQPIPAALVATFKSGSLGLCNTGGLGLVFLVKEFRRDARYKSATTKVFASLPSMGVGSAQTASALFTLATVFVIPIYTVMVVAPHSNWTRKLVESNIPYVVLGIIYVYLLVLSPTSDTFQLMFSSKHYLPELICLLGGTVYLNQ